MMGGGAPRWSAHELESALSAAQEGGAQSVAGKAQAAASPPTPNPASDAGHGGAGGDAGAAAGASAAEQALYETGRQLGLPDDVVRDALDAFQGDSATAEGYLRRAAPQWARASVHTAKRRAPSDGGSAPAPAQRARREPATTAVPADAAPTGAAAAPKPPPALVLWDLDETLILFNSLVTGTPPFTTAAATAAQASGAETEAEALRKRGAALGAPPPQLSEQRCWPAEGLWWLSAGRQGSGWST